MICLFCTPETDTRYRVHTIHYKPERLSAERRAAGHMVDLTDADIPRPEQLPRKSPVLYWNPETNELWYEYIDRPPTQDELLQEYMDKLDALEQMLRQFGENMLQMQEAMAQVSKSLDR
jgi:hypothetical protein